MSYMGKVRPTVALTSSDIEDNAVTSSKIIADAVTTAKMDDDAVGIAELSATGTASSSTYLRGDNAWTALSEYDDSGVQDDIALLGFKVASNGSLAKYNLVDQTVDAFEDATGIDASTSTGEFRASDNYYSGITTSSTQTALTTVESSTTTIPAGLVGSVNLLVVGGGGSSGEQGNACAGAGAGGLVYISNYAAVAGATYSYTIGAGGTGGTSYDSGTSGADSIFDSGGSHQTITGKGGGFGGTIAFNADDGGSGGGAANGTNKGASNQAEDFGSYTGVGFGNDGGSGGESSNKASGGGGAGSAGSGASTTGNGGSGKDYSSVFGTGVGEDGWFAGGGGGGSCGVDGTQGYGNGGSGNKGGGGDGQWYTAATSEAGMANTGGAAGGGTCDQNGGNGGSGVIILKYDAISAYQDMTLVSTATTAESAPTKGDIVFTYTDGAGTAVVGTDITADYSADDGSNWTPFSIGASDAQGTTGGHTIVTKHNVALTSASGTSMRYRINTLNQSALKTTRIQAVSLGWS